MKKEDIIKEFGKTPLKFDSYNIISQNAIFAGIENGTYVVQVHIKMPVFSAAKLNHHSQITIEEKQSEINYVSIYNGKENYPVHYGTWI